MVWPHHVRFHGLLSCPCPPVPCLLRGFQVWQLLVGSCWRSDCHLGVWGKGREGWESWPCTDVDDFHLCLVWPKKQGWCGPEWKGRTTKSEKVMTNCQQVTSYYRGKKPMSQSYGPFVQYLPVCIFNVQRHLLSSIRGLSCKEVRIVGLRWGCIFRTNWKLRRYILFSFCSSSRWTPWWWAWIRCSRHYGVCWRCRMTSTAAVATPTTILTFLVVSRCLCVNIYCAKRSHSRHYLYHRSFTAIWYLLHYLLKNRPV